AVLVSSLLLATSGCSADAPAGSSDVATATQYQTGVGPIALPPGHQQTHCVVLRLDTREGGFVRRFRADLTAGSHHMIVYQSLDTTESLTPPPCQARGGITQGGDPA